MRPAYSKSVAVTSVMPRHGISSSSTSIPNCARGERRTTRCRMETWKWAWARGRERDMDMDMDMVDVDVDVDVRVGVGVGVGMDGARGNAVAEPA
eukprot:412416-Prymnesium_polylepis.2